MVTLDEENMQIGLGAMKGTLAHVYEGWIVPIYLVVFEFGIFLATTVLVLICINYLQRYYYKRERRNDHVSTQEAVHEKFEDDN